MWPDRRFLDLVGIEVPIIQAPMATFVTPDLVVAVSEAGGLGSLPCAALSPDQVRAELSIIRQRTSRPVCLNFFYHQPPRADSTREQTWRERLAGYYSEFDVDPPGPASSALRPFDSAMCDLVEELAPEVLSFHLGFPDKPLVERLKSTLAAILCTATTVEEARWLEAEGCDAIIAQGVEAGGHRGMFQTNDISTQMGTMALVPQVVDAVKVPVIAAGGIGDDRGIAAAFMLGAAGVQMGTAFLFCPETQVSPIHWAALTSEGCRETALTNVLSGRPARSIVNRLMREVGPMSDLVPDFPLAGSAFAPVRAKAEAEGAGDFSPLWSGQAAALGQEMPAGELTTQLAGAALARLSRWHGPDALLSVTR
jgi:nitronate monooxygenase